MATNTSVSVTTGSTSLIASSVRSFVITNIGTAGVVWIAIGQAVAEVGKGIPLAPAASAGLIGGSFTFNDPDLYQSPISAISAAGTNAVAIYYV